jgi:hypothetical protein
MMSEITTEAVESAEGQEQEQAADQAFTQSDVDRIVKDRLQRERDKLGDVKALKAKADQFDQLEESKKSENEKFVEKLTKAEAEVAQIPARVAEQLRGHLVALHEINGDDAELFLTANDPELLLKQVQRLVGRESERKKQGNFVPREGSTSKNIEGDEREAVRSLFG